MPKKNPFSRQGRAAGATKRQPAKSQVRAEEPAKDDDKPESAEMQKCEHCEGSGEMPDGSMCESCGGTGKVAAASADDETDPSGDAGDGDLEGGDGDGDGDDMGAEQDEDKKEEAALATLRAKFGLPATASRTQVMLAAAAAPRAESMSAQVSKLVAEQFAAEKAKSDKAAAKAAAKQLVADAMKGGYADEDKGALLALALTGPSGLQAAERLAKPFLARARELYGKTAVGGALASDNRPSTPGVQVKQMGGVRIVKHGMTLSAQAKALSKKEKISYEAALDRVVKENPEVYQQYLEGMN